MSCQKEHYPIFPCTRKGTVNYYRQCQKGHDPVAPDYILGICAILPSSIRAVSTSFSEM